MHNILVTGGAGFIGSHLVERLLQQNLNVICLDNFDPFYDKSVKLNNIASAKINKNYSFVEGDIRDNKILNKLPDVDTIIHLAAKAGVRPSIEQAQLYHDVNVTGTVSLLDFAKDRAIKKFVFGSSSSIYGVNKNVPWKESERQIKPISPYAASKVSAELLGHVYCHLYPIQFIGLRFFTVFGPRQRPDLAIHKFANRLLNKEPIPMYGDGSSLRDYTFVTDIVDGILGALSYNESQFEIVNLGNNQLTSLIDLIAHLEDIYGIKAQIHRLPNMPGDVPKTYADITKAKKLFGYKPKVGIREGLEVFAKWHQEQVNS